MADTLSMGTCERIIIRLHWPAVSWSRVRASHMHARLPRSRAAHTLCRRTSQATTASSSSQPGASALRAVAMCCSHEAGMQPRTGPPNRFFFQRGSPTLSQSSSAAGAADHHVQHKGRGACEARTSSCFCTDLGETGHRGAAPPRGRWRRARLQCRCRCCPTGSVRPAPIPCYASQSLSTTPARFAHAVPAPSRHWITM